MDLSVQFKLNEDNLLHRYIRENSYWYKILNRNPSLISNMTDEMKDKYKLHTSDKIEEIGNKISMIESILKVFE
ncbi:unknown [Clostridium sp. CAG:1193]|nr:unknown [Clostridium sp. CAG:1193]